MKLLEFLEWCELNNWITHHKQIPNDYDHEADSHHKITIHPDEIVVLHMVYAKMQGQAIMVRGYLYLGEKTIERPTMSQITEACFPDGI